MSSPTGEKFSDQSAEVIQLARQKMADAKLPEVVINNFERLFRQVLSGNTGVILDSEIEPATRTDTLAAVAAIPGVLERGRELLKSLVVVRLNGGLGTTMGLDRAKSLLAVKGGLTFNDIIARQLVKLGRETGVRIPLVHMTSFSTDGDIRAFMADYPQLSPDALPTTFLQHKHPKVYADTMLPANEPEDEMNWNPPGHGDIYAALMATGIAERLLSLGKRYMFVANADNLGAVVEPAILGYLAHTGAPFLMETAERTLADSKGGHLAKRRSNGRLLLRESGQAPVQANGELVPEFRDVSRYNQFNTNTIWLDLEAVVSVAKAHDGCIGLPLISNKKTVNPRDRASRKVIQIETAMGAAIEVFDGACALQVPRSRFAPVKSNNDLLVVRSDAYMVDDHFNLVPTCNPLPIVSLDSRHYGLLADFEERIRVVPSLRKAHNFEVRGDIIFNHPIEIRGSVRIIAEEGKQVVVPTDLTVIENKDLHL